MTSADGALPTRFAHFGDRLEIWPDRLVVRHGRWLRWPLWRSNTVVITREALHSVDLLAWGPALLIEDHQGRVLTVALGARTPAAYRALTAFRDGAD